mmetsp:Transcript_18457/g.37082  ORF Transcript_18457/g.37082 Transcript_18457/m.37082 type:complete len:143 (+) Transcript_18457:144-572(+)
MKFARVAAILLALSLASPTSAFTTPAYRTQITATATGNNYRSYSTYLKESTVEEDNAEDTAVEEKTQEQQPAPAVAVESSIPPPTTTTQHHPPPPRTNEPTQETKPPSSSELPKISLVSQESMKMATQSVNQVGICPPYPPP